jgi:hypothetical protein
MVRAGIYDLPAPAVSDCVLAPQPASGTAYNCTFWVRPPMAGVRQDEDFDVPRQGAHQKTGGACEDPMGWLPTPWRVSTVHWARFRLPDQVRILMLRGCSSSPRQMPPRSALPSKRVASSLPPSSCAGGSLVFRTTSRRGPAFGSLPAGSRRPSRRAGSSGCTRGGPNRRCQAERDRLFFHFVLVFLCWPSCPASRPSSSICGSST